MKKLKGMILRMKEIRVALRTKVWGISHLKEYKTEVGEGWDWKQKGAGDA